MSYIWPWPKGTSINQPFGSNPGGVNPAGGHTGMDAGTPPNTPVYAPAAGRIEYAQWFTTDYGSDNPYLITNGGGISVVLNCGNSAPTFVFSHLNSTSKNTGDWVNQGDIIGLTGNTGKWTTGPHLHFEALPAGYNIRSNTYGRVNPGLFCAGYKGDSSIKANQRKTGSQSANQRAEANTKSKIIRTIPANSLEEFSGYVIGENFHGINIWFKDSAGYAWAGSFLSQSTAGLANLTPKPTPPPALKANQRKTGSGEANQRAEASTKSKIVRKIPANSVEEFTGFVYGENFNNVNVWFKDSIGYVWAGAFLNQATTGLTNLSPKTPTLKATQRIVGPKGANVRAEAKASAPIIRTAAPNTVEDFTGYVVGERIDGWNLWYKDSKGYAWCGGFTSQVTTGLKDLTPKAPVEAPKPPAPVDKPTTPSAPVYSFKPDFDFVEYIPADYENVMDAATVGKEVFPPKPQKVVIHQFGTLGVDTINSTINTFKNPTSQASAHFVVAGSRIIQMVSLSDRAFHAYTVGNDYIGIETDPAQDPATIESTKKLLKALKAKYGYKVTPVLHRNVPLCSTNCGAAIDLAKYEIDSVAKPVPAPAPVKPSPAPVVDERAVLLAYATHQIDVFLKNKK